VVDAAMEFSAFIRQAERDAELVDAPSVSILLTSLDLDQSQFFITLTTTGHLDYRKAIHAKFHVS
jgi:cyclophilin family peptidyl-prolyl cis-trans isomerase